MHHAPCTTHHAPRTTHHAPRTTPRRPVAPSPRRPAACNMPSGGSGTVRMASTSPLRPPSAPLLAQERRRSREERALRTRMRPYARHHAEAPHEQLLRDMLEESALRRRAVHLSECASKGMRNLYEAERLLRKPPRGLNALAHPHALPSAHRAWHWSSSLPPPPPPRPPDASTCVRAAPARWPLGGERGARLCMHCKYSTL